MAHRLSFNNGRAEMAYTGEQPWHGLGERVEGLQSAQDMLKHAGLLWTVGAAPVFCNSLEIEGYKAVVRGDNQRVLGIVSDHYTPIQNTQAGDIVDALVTDGGAHVEVAGALDDGQRCWMLAHIPVDFEVVKGDQIRPYFLLAWGHDGKHGVAGKLTNVRVVCNNTLTATGFGQGKWKQSAAIFIKHSKNAKLQIAEAQEALGLARKQAAETAQAYQVLARTPMPEPARYFADVFPFQAAGEGSQAQVATPEYQEKLNRWNAHQARLLDLFESGKGSDIPGVRGTAWAGYNAVTEWVDHVYPVLQSGAVSQQRQQSVLFGSYADVRERALFQALAL